MGDSDPDEPDLEDAPAVDSGDEDPLPTMAFKNSNKPVTKPKSLAPPPKKGGQNKKQHQQRGNSTVSQGSDTLNSSVSTYGTDADEALKRMLHARAEHDRVMSEKGRVGRADYRQILTETGVRGIFINEVTGGGGDTTPTPLAVAALHACRSSGGDSLTPFDICGNTPLVASATPSPQSLNGDCTGIYAGPDSAIAAAMGVPHQGVEIKLSTSISSVPQVSHLVDPHTRAGPNRLLLLDNKGMRVSMRDMASMEAVYKQNSDRNQPGAAKALGTLLAIACRVGGEAGMKCEDLPNAAIIRRLADWEIALSTGHAHSVRAFNGAVITHTPMGVDEPANVIGCDLEVPQAPEWSQQDLACMCACLAGSPFERVSHHVDNINFAAGAATWSGDFEFFNIQARFNSTELDPGLQTDGAAIMLDNVVALLTWWSLRTEADLVYGGMCEAATKAFFYPPAVTAPSPANQVGVRLLADQVYDQTEPPPADADAYQNLRNLHPHEPIIPVTLDPAAPHSQLYDEVRIGVNGPQTDEMVTPGQVMEPGRTSNAKYAAWGKCPAINDAIASLLTDVYACRPIIQYHLHAITIRDPSGQFASEYIDFAAFPTAAAAGYPQLADMWGALRATCGQAVTVGGAVSMKPVRPRYGTPAIHTQNSLDGQTPVDVYGRFSGYSSLQVSGATNMQHISYFILGLMYPSNTSNLGYSPGTTLKGRLSTYRAMAMAHHLLFTLQAIPYGLSIACAENTSINPALIFKSNPAKFPGGIADAFTRENTKTATAMCREHPAFIGGDNQTIGLGFGVPGAWHIAEDTSILELKTSDPAAIDSAVRYCYTCQSGFGFDLTTDSDLPMYFICHKDGVVSPGGIPRYVRPPPAQANAPVIAQNVRFGSASVSARDTRATPARAHTNNAVLLQGNNAFQREIFRVSASPHW